METIVQIQKSYFLLLCISSLVKPNRTQQMEIFVYQRQAELTSSQRASLLGPFSEYEQTGTQTVSIFAFMPDYTFCEAAFHLSNALSHITITG